MIYLVYSLMFLTSLATALYVAALGVKLSARLRNPLSRALLALMMPAAVVIAGLGLSMFARDVCDPYFMSAGSCSETGGVTLTWVYRALIGWTIAGGLGSLVVLVAGFQNRGWTPASSEWHAEGLFFRGVIALVLTAALFFAADSVVTSQLKSELAWHQTLYEWSEPLPPEGGDEGRKAYVGAFTAMQRIFNSPDAEGSLPEWWEDAFKPDSGVDFSSYEVRKFVWDNKDIYDLIANAASAQAFNMSDKGLQSFSPLSPHDMGRMLFVSARVNTGRTWFISAMRDIRNILNMDLQNRKTTDFSGYITSLGLRAYALGALQEAVSRPGFYGIDPVLYPKFDDLSGTPLLRNHIRRMYAGGTAEILSELTSSSDREMRQAERFKKTLYRVFMARHALCCFETGWSVFSGKPISFEDNKGVPGDCKVYSSEEGAFFLSKLYSRLAGSRGAELAMATVKYYRRNHRYPADITELAPAFIEDIPADPFDDKSSMAMADDGGDLLFYSPAYEKQKGERVGFRLKKQ